MANQASEATSKTRERERKKERESERERERENKSFYSQNNALAALLAITQGINHAVFQAQFNIQTVNCNLKSCFSQKNAISYKHCINYVISKYQFNLTTY